MLFEPTEDDIALYVAPLVGARIEIPIFRWSTLPEWSLPSWERGLKFCHIHKLDRVELVAPLVGARIEME